MAIKDDLGHGCAVPRLILDGVGASSGEGRERPQFAQSGDEGVGVAIGARQSQVQTTRGANDASGHWASPTKPDNLYAASWLSKDSSNSIGDMYAMELWSRSLLYQTSHSKTAFLASSRVEKCVS